MRKRFASLFLALVMALSMVPPAFAASGNPPYSLPYLKDIQGAEYVRTITYDDYVSDGDTFTQYTVDIYDVLVSYLSNNGDWSKIIAPFRAAFQAAGYRESVELDEYNQEEYAYVLGGDGFFIMGEKASQAVMNESGIVYVAHLYLAPDADASTDTQTPDSTASGGAGTSRAARPCSRRGEIMGAPSGGPGSPSGAVPPWRAPAARGAGPLPSCGAGSSGPSPGRRPRRP